MPLREREKAEIRALKEFLKKNKGKWVCVYEGFYSEEYKYWREVTFEVYINRGIFDRISRETEDEPKHRIMMRYR